MPVLYLLLAFLLTTVSISLLLLYFLSSRKKRNRRNRRRRIRTFFILLLGKIKDACGGIFLLYPTSRPFHQHQYPSAVPLSAYPTCPGPPVGGTVTRSFFWGGILWYGRSIFFFFNCGTIWSSNWYKKKMYAYY